MNALELVKEVAGEALCECAEISTEIINFSEAVVSACKANACGRYGKSWVCPPGVGELPMLRERYERYGKAIVFTTVHSIEDSFDFEGMMEAQEAHSKIDAELLRRLDGGQTLLGSGGCRLCEECTYPDSPCRHPRSAVPSVEACGIDVVALAGAAGIRYHNGANTVTYFSVLFFD